MSCSVLHIETSYLTLFDIGIIKVKSKIFCFALQAAGALFTNNMEPRHGIMKAFPKVKRAKALQGKDAPPLKKKPDESVVTGHYSVGMFARMRNMI